MVRVLNFKVITNKRHVANSKYPGTAVTNKTCIHKEIKSRLNLWNTCYHSAQNL